MGKNSLKYSLSVWMNWSKSLELANRFDIFKSKLFLNQSWRAHSRAHTHIQYITHVTTVTHRRSVTSQRGQQSTTIYCCYTKPRWMGLFLLCTGIAAWMAKSCYCCCLSHHNSIAMHCSIQSVLNHLLAALINRTTNMNGLHWVYDFRRNGEISLTRILRENDNLVCRYIWVCRLFDIYRINATKRYSIAIPIPLLSNGTSFIDCLLAFIWSWANFRV